MKLLFVGCFFALTEILACTPAEVQTEKKVGNAITRYECERLLASDAGPFTLTAPTDAGDILQNQK